MDHSEIVKLDKGASNLVVVSSDIVPDRRKRVALHLAAKQPQWSGKSLTRDRSERYRRACRRGDMPLVSVSRSHPDRAVATEQAKVHMHSLGGKCTDEEVHGEGFSALR